MASLRETKDRIASVRSTLKITSAMKLVASSKLRKAQKAIESLRPYEQALDSIVSQLSVFYSPKSLAEGAASMPGGDAFPSDGSAGASASGKTAVVVIASNNSLCGAFNANVLRCARQFVDSLQGSEYEIFAIGRKAVEGFRGDSSLQGRNLTEMVAHPSYELASSFARELEGRFDSGEFSRVVLVYNRYISASQQKSVCEQLLPFSFEDNPTASLPQASLGEEVDCCSPLPQEEEVAVNSEQREERIQELRERFLYEPEPERIVSMLLPQLLCLKMHAAILDSVAAEHSARTMAMQTATDNAEHLLSDLTLEYNKGRQQKITSEILDLVGGSL